MTLKSLGESVDNYLKRTFEDRPHRHEWDEFEPGRFACSNCRMTAVGPNHYILIENYARPCEKPEPNSTLMTLTVELAGRTAKQTIQVPWLPYALDGMTPSGGLLGAEAQWLIDLEDRIRDQKVLRLALMLAYTRGQRAD